MQAYAVRAHFIGKIYGSRVDKCLKHGPHLEQDHLRAEFSKTNKPIKTKRDYQFYRQ